MDDILSTIYHAHNAIHSVEGELRLSYNFLKSVGYFLHLAAKWLA
jgi:hypothetical protein